MMKRVLPAAFAGLLMSFCIQGAQATTQVDILRSVPLEISGYNLPKDNGFTTASELLGVMDGQKSLLVHMELMRRSYLTLPESEKEKLLSTLYTRYKTSENDTIKFFDHGYAQMLYKKNKTGLFFLRKANDRIGDQFSSLAYAMAEAEADVELENAGPAEMTTRKLSVMFNLRDSLARQKASAKPGFWPSFVRFIAALQPLDAYDDFTDTDFSLDFVPYGNSVTAATVGASAGMGGAAASIDTATSCSVRANRVTPTETPGTLFGSRMVDFDNDKQFETVRFYTEKPMQAYSADERPTYRVVITDNQGRLLGEMSSRVAPYIVEDLNGDGAYEVVIRQYQADPYHPVLVHRLTECGFEEDKTVYGYFQ